MDSFAILPHLKALAIAYVLALPIAWDREKEGRSAGLRTFPLVAIAACGFIQACEGFLRGEAEATARIVEGVIGGIGFIGGGAILKGSAGIHGTATAAALWATGAIGIASALGAYDVAVVISLMTFLTLALLTPLKSNKSEPPGPI
ncbi:MgtC/SapB family protein [Muricoccus radiodurans]|uniref:MgtC/SapB family protein n=1 Tax=Muricoccus radiodurans TaxID=2231721 RepID=UPI003CEE4787